MRAVWLSTGHATIVNTCALVDMSTDYAIGDDSIIGPNIFSLIFFFIRAAQNPKPFRQPREVGHTFFLSELPKILNHLEPA